MVVVIDASNIRSGGGLTHLKGILENYNVGFGFKKVVVYSNLKTLKVLPDKDWLVKETHRFLNKSSLWSFIFQIFILSSHATKKYKCDIIFSPGGTFFGGFKPFVTMSRNMLPFEFREAVRFESWKVRIRFIILFLTQSITFKRASGIIFLTKYAKEVILKKVKKVDEKLTIIPHGVDPYFLNIPKLQLDLNTYTFDKPYKFLYVSAISAYKHQWNVAEAIFRLNEEGFPVTLDLIGPGSGESLDRLNRIVKSKRNNNKSVNYLGLVEHKKLANYYKNADAFIFASSCENMPNILIEAMISGLPIASSSKGPMPEVLQDGGLYFDPLDVQSIYECLKELIVNKDTRTNITENARKINFYSWGECSERTFKYLLKVTLISQKANTQ